jgi:serum/glucocorticoid-regulated kinase 2
MLKCIGVGGFSKVYLSRDKRDGEFYAAKFIDKEKVSGKMDLIYNEREVNELIAFPFLVQMREFF